MKYYFENLDSENCYSLDYFKEKMAEEEITEMQVFPAKMVKGKEYFWCDEYFEVGITKESCGKSCEGYTPRNGKNGRCKYHKNTCEPSDEPIIIRSE